MDKALRKNLIIIAIIVGIFLFVTIRCSYSKYNKLDSDQTIIEKTEQYVATEKIEHVSSKKNFFKPTKTLKFKSLERDLTFETTVFLKYTNLSSEQAYFCTYYKEIFEYHKNDIIKVLNKYYSSDQYKFQEYGDYEEDYFKDDNIEDTLYYVLIEVRNQEDIDNFIKAANEINDIYAEEKKYSPVDEYLKLTATSEISTYVRGGKTYYYDSSTHVFDEERHMYDVKDEEDRGVYTYVDVTGDRLDDEAITKIRQDLTK